MASDIDNRLSMEAIPEDFTANTLYPVLNTNSPSGLDFFKQGKKVSGSYIFDEGASGGRENIFFQITPFTGGMVGRPFVFKFSVPLSRNSLDG